MLTPRHNPHWSAVLCISVVAGSGHIPINKVTLSSLILEAARQADAGADCSVQPASPQPEDPDKSDSSANIASAVGCDAWNRAGPPDSARLTTLLSTVHRAWLHLTPAPQPPEAPAATGGFIYLTLPRAASRPNRPHAPPQRG